MAFDRAGVGGASVLQNSGQIVIGADNVNAATLEADKGLTMNHGSLTTAAGQTCKIAVGDVTIAGGVVNVGNSSGTGELDCDGKVTMSGGVYVASVDLTANTNSVWKSTKGFSLPGPAGQAVLQVDSLNIPGTLPVKQQHHLLEAPNKGISGDFSGWHVAIGNTGKSYTAAPDMNKQNYDATTP